MNYKEITDLVKLINKTDLSEFKLKDKDFEIQIRTKFFQSGKNVVQSAAPMLQIPTMPPAAGNAAESKAPAAKAEVAGPPKKAEPAENLLEIKSPIVGTFYRAPGADKAPFVKVGDTIDKGSVVCIVEAMKLFNEIESEVAGTIVKVLIEDAQPVEYDQVLFLVDPNK